MKCELRVFLLFSLARRSLALFYTVYAASILNFDLVNLIFAALSLTFRGQQAGLFQAR